MAEQIRDGTGTGNLVKVDSTNRLLVDAKSASLQHSISHDDQLAFQVVSAGTPTNGTTTITHIKNTSNTRNLIITFIRIQSLGLTGGTSIPDSSNYWSIRLGRTYVSDGSLLTPVNVSAGSSNSPEATIYNSNPTLTGTALEIDRYYPVSDGDKETYNKESALIVPPGQTFEIAYVGDHTSGTLYARVSFFMEEI